MDSGTVRSSFAWIVLTTILWAAAPALADVRECTASAQANDGVIYANLNCVTASSEDAPRSGDPEMPPPKNNWVPTCPRGADHASCVQQEGCEPDTEPWNLLGNQFGEWIVHASECRSTSPTITPAAVATAFQRIPLPELRSTSQPATKTLVNFDTIFYVEAETLDRRIRLLGQDVDLTITPTRFRWTFGDGTDQVTTNPGDAYPAKTLTHRYQRAHVTVNHQVEVTWTATWRVNNGPWQEVPGSVTIAGPRTPLRIVEAVPLLSGADR